MNHVSGDYCRWLPGAMVEHYRCDDYRDGTVTSVLDGSVVIPARYDSPKGFNR